MRFWELPDEKQTADNVDKFLRGQCSRLAMQCGINLTNLSSPTLSDAPAHGSSVNSQEIKMLNGLNAYEGLKAIAYTISHTYGISPQLLFLYYFKNMPVWQIRNKLRIDHNSFGYLKVVALNQFADCWQNTQDKFEWQDRDRIDLRIYPKPEAKSNGKGHDEKKETDSKGQN